MSLRGLCCNAVLVANNVECGRLFLPFNDFKVIIFFTRLSDLTLCEAVVQGITNVTPDSHKGDVVTGHYCCDTREEEYSPLTPAHDTSVTLCDTV